MCYSLMALFAKDPTEKACSVLPGEWQWQRPWRRGVRALRILRPAIEHHGSGRHPRRYSGGLTGGVGAAGAIGTFCDGAAAAAPCTGSWARAQRTLKQPGERANGSAVGCTAFTARDKVPEDCTQYHFIVQAAGDKCSVPARRRLPCSIGGNCAAQMVAYVPHVGRPLAAQFLISESQLMVLFP